MCIGQKSSPINIHEIFITDSSEIRSSSDFKIKTKNKAFYEDEDYIVSTICNGEWGGAITFKSKKTGVEYSCSSTCPVIVNRIDGKYYVTNSLSHMSGSTDVIEIDDPTKMYILEKPASKQTLSSLYHSPEAFYKQGIKRLADTVGILTTKTFTVNKKLYHLMREFWGGEIYISTIENGHFKIIDSLPDGNLLHFSKTFETNDDHYVMFFDSDPVNGYIDIYGNEIKIFRFDRLKGRKYDPVLAWQLTDLQKKRYYYLIDSLYDRNFDDAAFQKQVSISSKNVKPEFIYQALFNSDSSKFVAYYLGEKKAEFNSYVYWETNSVFGKKINNKWYYSIYLGGLADIYYAKSREAMQRYLFNKLQEQNFFKENSIKPDPAFWESRYFKDIRIN